jgi:AcrR family transcriptional regulator
LTRSAKSDRRVERTRQAILGAFRDLILTQGYDAITVRDVVDTAGVGRSTFYEHFDDKERLFEASVKPLLSMLAEAVGQGADAVGQGADAVGQGADRRRLELVIEHFGQNRRLVRVVLAGPARRLMSRFLAELIESRLASAVRAAHGSKPLIPLSLIAVHLAEAQLGLIQPWLLAKNPCPPEALAHALGTSTRASAAALLAVRKS